VPKDTGDHDDDEVYKSLGSLMMLSRTRLSGAVLELGVRYSANNDEMPGAPASALVPVSSGMPRLPIKPLIVLLRSTCTMSPTPFLVSLCTWRAVSVVQLLIGLQHLDSRAGR
jgi:hypothetical protein